MNGFHHIRARARVARGLEPFPATNTWKSLLDYVMYAVGLLAPLSLLPQILQVYETQSSDGLSLTTWSLFVLINALWATYGIVHKDTHILFANLFMMTFNLIVVIEVLVY